MDVNESQTGLTVIHNNKHQLPQEPVLLVVEDGQQIANVELTIDMPCRFQLASLPAGKYRLTIRPVDETRRQPFGQEG